MASKEGSASACEARGSAVAVGVAALVGQTCGLAPACHAALAWLRAVGVGLALAAKFSLVVAAYIVVGAARFINTCFT